MTTFNPGDVAQSRDDNTTIGGRCLWQRRSDGRWHASAPTRGGEYATTTDTPMSGWIRSGICELIWRAPEPAESYYWRDASGDYWVAESLTGYALLIESFEAGSEPVRGFETTVEDALSAWGVWGQPESFCFKDADGDWWAALDFDGVWRLADNVEVEVDLFGDEVDPFGDEDAVVECNFERRASEFGIVDDGVTVTTC
jgi:hypothetical protein